MTEQFATLPLLARGAAALGVQLTDAQYAQFAILARELLVWNTRVNLTGIRNADEIETRHFVDSLTVIPLLRAWLGDGEGSLVDVGAGAGLPGLAIAIALPRLQGTLVEATAKKVQFIEHVIGMLELPHAWAVHGRAEELAHVPAYRERFDVAVARAVGSVATLVELLVPFLVPGGRAILMKTRPRVDAELVDAAGALQALRSTVVEVRENPGGGVVDAGVLVVVRKEGPTPEQYPRRAGIPGRRPLK